MRKKYILADNLSKDELINYEAKLIEVSNLVKEFNDKMKKLGVYFVAFPSDGDVGAYVVDNEYKAIEPYTFEKPFEI
ncbi:hypothetical protein EZS27_034159, partial [termite gut metagenome]